jgi:hypothetical protein
MRGGAGAGAGGGISAPGPVLCTSVGRVQSTPVGNGRKGHSADTCRLINLETFGCSARNRETTATFRNRLCACCWGTEPSLFPHLALLRFRG